MTPALQVLSFLLLSLGVGFIIAAAVGVLRFPDALQRMHASTKAGTLGAILVLGGAMLALEPDALPVGALAILFMLLTVPVAAHLLGRAAYVSGAPMRMMVGRNALLHVLERQKIPLEERTEFVAYAPSLQVGSSSPERSGTLPEMTELRLALIAPEIAPILARSLAIRRTNKVPLKAIAVVDEAFLNATGDVQGTRVKVRENVARAIEEMETLLPKRRSFFTLSYEEGDPMRLIPSHEDLGSLLVLPGKGWCHHGVDIATPFATGRPEGLLRLSDHHAGCILYLGRKAMNHPPVVVVSDDGSDAIVRGLEWALNAKLWQNPQLLLVGMNKAIRTGIYDEIARRHGCIVLPPLFHGAGPTTLPSAAAYADAWVTTSLPSPKRADWYGMFWQDNIAPGWAGEVLLVPSAAEHG